MKIFGILKILLYLCMTKLINMNFFTELAREHSLIGIHYTVGVARNTETNKWFNSHSIMIGFGMFHIGVIWLTNEIDKPDFGNE